MFDLSIVLPTRNRADHLLKALMGIERGTHCTYEVIVVDGASTDSDQRRADAGRLDHGHAAARHPRRDA